MARCILTGMSPGLALQAVNAHMDLLRVQPILDEGLALALAENRRGHN